VREPTTPPAGTTKPEPPPSPPAKRQPDVRIILTLDCEGCGYRWNMTLEPGKVAGMHRCARCLQPKARALERAGKRQAKPA
jgi:hypothetical protein